MIKTVAIDLASGSGEHKVRCLDEKAQPCDGFTFTISSEGLANLEKRVFSQVADQIIVCTPPSGTHYNCGRITTDHFSVSLPPGTCHLVFNNEYSLISTKQVTTTVNLTWTGSR